MELIQPTVEQPAKNLLMIPNILPERSSTEPSIPKSSKLRSVFENEYFTTEALFESKDTDILEEEVDILDGEVLELLLKRASLGRTTEEGKLLIFLLPSTRVYQNEKKKKDKMKWKTKLLIFLLRSTKVSLLISTTVSGKGGLSEA